MNPQNKKILITGAAGFLGANLVRSLLAHGANVHCLVRKQTDLWRLQDIINQLNFHFVDLTDQRKLKKIFQHEMFDIVVHLAMPHGHPKTGHARLDYLKNSIIGTANLMEAVNVYPPKKVICAGSILEYGAHSIPLNESTMLSPHTFRGISKLSSTLLCQHYAVNNHIPVIILRLSSIYGPWEGAHRFIPTMLLSGLYEQTIELTGPGIYHDFLFIEDVVTAFFQAMMSETTPGEILNIGSGVQWANEEVVKEIERLMEKKLRINVGAYRNSPADAKHCVVDIEKARKIIGFRPTYKLSDGLELTLKWINQQGKHYGEVRKTSND